MNELRTENAHLKQQLATLEAALSPKTVVRLAWIREAIAKKGG